MMSLRTLTLMGLTSDLSPMSGPGRPGGLPGITMAQPEMILSSDAVGRLSEVSLPTALIINFGFPLADLEDIHTMNTV